VAKDSDKKTTTPETGAKEEENAQPTASDPDPDVPPAAPKENLNPSVPTLTKNDKADEEEKPKKKVDRLAKFLRKTGFDEADVDVVHQEAGIFGTVQGGKYKLSKSGEIITLKGPVPTVAEEEEE